MSTGARVSFFGAAQATAGKARVCPHCKATILDSAAICPACHRYLRYEQAAEQRPVPALSPLRVAATMRHPDAGEPWEYSVLLSVTNDRGDEVSRQVVGVGALQPGELRTFNLTVEIYPHASRPK
jgi:hypothetical protein